MALDRRQNFVSAQYLESKLTYFRHGQDFTKLYKCIYIDKI